MRDYQIGVIVGSLRQDSINRKLAAAVSMQSPADFTFKQIEIGDLPLYNQDDDTHPAEEVQRFKAAIIESQGLLFVTPEYNRSVSGVLKNALDHASRPHGKSVWLGKPAGVMGASIGVIGTAIAQQHLRNILACLDVPTMGLPEVFIHAKEGYFDHAGNIDDNNKKFIQQWMDRYVAWVKLHATGSTPQA